MPSLGMQSDIHSFKSGMNLIHNHIFCILVTNECLVHKHTVSPNVLIMTKFLLNVNMQVISISFTHQLLQWKRRVDQCWLSLSWSIFTRFFPKLGWTIKWILTVMCIIFAISARLCMTADKKREPTYLPFPPLFIKYPSNFSNFIVFIGNLVTSDPLVRWPSTAQSLSGNSCHFCFHW